MWGFGRQIMGLLCFCVCLGPILIFVGLGLMLASGSDSRGTSISVYNNVVSQWNSVYLPQFQSANFFVQGYKGEWVPLMEDNSPDYINDDAAVSSYTPLKYYTNMSIVLQPQPFDAEEALTTFYFAENATQLTGMSTTIMMQSILYPGDGSYNTLNCNDDDDDDSDDCESACEYMQGIWRYDEYDAGYCQVNQIISAFCMKVSNSAGTWQADYSYGGPGCYTRNLPLALYESTNGIGMMNFNGNITIRHAKDPHIYLGEVTNYAYNFGATQKQNFITGWILMIVGGIVLLPMIALVVYLSRRNRRRDSYESQRIYVAAPVQTYTYAGSPAPAYGGAIIATTPTYPTSPYPNSAYGTQPQAYSGAQVGYTQYAPQQPPTRPY